MDALALQVPLRQHTPRASADGPSAPRSAEGSCARARAISAGDPAEIERFYRATFSVAMGVAARASRRDESFCLDVVHDATLRLLKGVKPTLTEEQLDLYFKRCVISATIDRLRRDTRRRARERARGSTPDASHADEERIASLQAALARFDHLDHALLTSRFARGATIEEAAAAHGLSGPAAHGRLRRALERLRSIIIEEDR